MMKRTVPTVLMMSLAFLLFACSGEKLEFKVKASMDGQPAAQAKVTVDNEEQGFTGADGIFSKTLRKKPGVDVEVLVSKEMPGYQIKPWKGTFVMKLPKSGAEFTVTKSGYATWRKTGKVEPGQKLEATLSKRVIVTISTLMEEYGQSSGIPGIEVNISNKAVGKTDAKGLLIHTYDGEPGKKVPLTLSAPGYIPETWKTSIALGGEVSVQRYFYPTTPRPIRTGIYRFVSNAPHVDLKDMLSQTEASLAAQLFKTTCFREGPSQTLQAEMKQAKLSIEKITEKGWHDTPLRK